jgi:hypothetical protein
MQPCFDNHSFPHHIQTIRPRRDVPTKAKQRSETLFFNDTDLYWPPKISSSHSLKIIELARVWKSRNGRKWGCSSLNLDEIRAGCSVSTQTGKMRQSQYPSDARCGLEARNTQLPTVATKSCGLHVRDACTGGPAQLWAGAQLMAATVAWGDGPRSDVNS